MRAVGEDNETPADEAKVEYVGAVIDVNHEHGLLGLAPLDHLANFLAPPQFDEFNEGVADRVDRQGSNRVLLLNSVHRAVGNRRKPSETGPSPPQPAFSTC